MFSYILTNIKAFHVLKQLLTTNSPKHEDLAIVVATRELVPSFLEGWQTF